MGRSSRLVFGILALGFLLAACEEEPTRQVVTRREVKPPPGKGQTGNVCVIVKNRAPFTVTGRVVLKTRERTTFRLARNKSKRLCVVGTLYGNDTVSFVITNFVTVPIFSCFTRFDRAIEISAYRQQDGWLYNASCEKYPVSLRRSSQS